MKTNAYIILILLFLLPNSFLSAQQKESFATISGVVKDKQNKKKIEFVNIAIKGTNIGTVTNLDGEFSIKISDSISIKELVFSHIGYANHIYLVTDRSEKELTILLDRNSNMLDEVEISSFNPRELVRQTLLEVKNNYSSKPMLLSAFYRETVQKRNNYINISEAVIDIYKTAYDRSSIDDDRLQVHKGRRIISPRAKDTLAVKLQGGPHIAIFGDVVKNPNLLFDTDELEYYKFDIEPSIYIDDELHHVISFEPQRTVPYPLCRGKLYINKSKLILSRAQFGLEMEDKQKVTDFILKKKPAKLRFTPNEVSFLVDYKQLDGKSYLHYVRNEIRFACDWSRKLWLFSTGYTVISEMVVTDGRDNNVTRISRKNAFRPQDALSDNVNAFSNGEFWENYNIIEPTESLQSAVKKLKKQNK